MTLRWRFALALALLSVVVVSITGLVAYETTASRLSSAADSSLEQASSILVGQLPPPVHQATPALSGPGTTQGPPQRARQGGGGAAGVPPPPDLLNLVVEQRLNRAGNVIDDSGEIALPISSADRALATSGGVSILRTVTADGDPYRVITVALATGGAIQLGRDIRENEQLLSSLRLRLIVIAAIVSAMAALVGWLIAMRMTLSLKRLSSAAEEVARSGSLSVPITTEGRNEIGRLGRSFTTMLGALAQSRAQQKRLIEDAGHELRTPLTSLRANIDLLRRHSQLSDEQHVQILDDLNSELTELTVLVGELIELGTDRYAEGRAILVRVDELAEVAAARTRQRSGRHVDVESIAWELMGQSGAFERVIANLLDNAVKFSPDGTAIRVVVAPGYFEVRDQGPGLEQGDDEAIFERFYRSASARALPGSGLGLAIVKDTVERYGGHVFARNGSEGGAVIGFTLPTS